MRGQALAEQSDAERLIMLTDGVIAISITLLVLDIRLPAPAEGLDNAELWAAVRSIAPQLFSYVLSFVVVAVFWMTHMRKFRPLRRASPALLWLNVFFLLTVGLVPFTTSVLAESGNGTATALYAGVMALASLLLTLMSVHASAAGLLEESAGRRPGFLGTGLSLLVAIVFGLSIPLAFWDADWAKYFWLLLIPVSILQGRWARTNPGM
jgi:uncharacterized membrane protein